MNFGLTAGAAQLSFRLRQFGALFALDKLERELQTSACSRRELRRVVRCHMYWTLKSG